MSVRRSYHPQGTARQMVCHSRRRQSIEAVGDRSRCPTQIIHGKADPLGAGGKPAMISPQKISGSQIDVIDGMGHDPAHSALASFSLRGIADAAGRA